MSYPKQLVRLQPLGGLARDIPTSEVGPNHYTSGQNVQFRRGFAERVVGNRLAYDPPSVPPLDLINVQIQGTNYWVYVGEDTQHVVEGNTHSDITILTGLSTQPTPHRHSLSLLNGVVVHNNAIEPPMYWPGNPAFEFIELPDWPAGSVANKIISHRYHLFALNMDEAGGIFENKVMWSSAAEPGAIPQEWTPAADNEAGDAQLSDSPGPVLTGASLRETLLLYKRSSVYAADYVGGNFVYDFRPLFKGVGALTSKAVATTERGHYFVSDGDIVFTDGQQVQSIAHGRMRRRLFSNIDQDNFENLFTIYYRSKREIWIWYPEAGSTIPTHVLIYNVDSDAWGERDIFSHSAANIGVISDGSSSESWDSDSGFWDDDTSAWNETEFTNEERLMAANPDVPSLRIADDPTSEEQFDAMISKHDMHFGQPERFKFLRRIHLRADRVAGDMYLRIGTRNTPSESISWTAEITVAHDQQIINCNAIGRYISLEFRTEDGNTWEINGIDLEIEMRGYH